MNIAELTTKIDDIKSLLTVYASEAKDIADARVALETASYAATEREKRLNSIAISQAQQEKDLHAQRTYLDEQTGKYTRLLSGVQKERELLVISKMEREKFDKESAYLAVRETALENKTLELEKEKALFKKQETSTTELMEILSAREKRIRAKEESLNRREQLTQV